MSLVNKISCSLTLLAYALFVFSTTGDFFSFFYQKLQFTYVQATAEAFKPSKKNIQHFKKWNLLTFFLCLRVIFALLDPDPDPGTPFGSTALPESFNHSGPEKVFAKLPETYGTTPSPHRCPEQHSWASSCCSCRRCASPSRSRSRWIRRRRQSSQPPPPYACCCSPAAPN